MGAHNLDLTGDDNDGERTNELIGSKSVRTANWSSSSASALIGGAGLNFCSATGREKSSCELVSHILLAEFYMRTNARNASGLSVVAKHFDFSFPNCFGTQFYLLVLWRVLCDR